MLWIQQQLFKEIKEIGVINKKLYLKKAIAIVSYLLYLALIIIIFDIVVLHKFLGYGYPRHYHQENIQRQPAPYVEFTGKPSTMDHNEYGFPGPSFRQARPDDLKIAFFGGSTGYEGNPPIPVILKRELEKLTGLSVFVANYSVVSSNHRQHLHAIIEYLPQFQPDLIVFYGGSNETLQHAYYDPRPGYPFNYFYRAETGPFLKLLMENSAIAGILDRKLGGRLVGLKKLQNEQQPFSDNWNNRIVEKYLETLRLANNVAGTLESKKFGKTKFLAFYQPYQVPDKFKMAHINIRRQTSSLKFAFDVSSEYDILGNNIYTDYVHVKQPANEAMGAKIAQIIAQELQLVKKTADVLVGNLTPPPLDHVQPRP